MTKLNEEKLQLSKQIEMIQQQTSNIQTSFQQVHQLVIILYFKIFILKEKQQLYTKNATEQAAYQQQLQVLS